MNRVGPSLHGVVDRRAAEVPDYKYSDAMRSSGQVWSAESLYTFLEAPRTAVPGTKMTFAGVRNAQSRADIVAYLSTLR